MALRNIKIMKCTTGCTMPLTCVVKSPVNEQGGKHLTNRSLAMRMDNFYHPLREDVATVRFVIAGSAINSELWMAGEVVVALAPKIPGTSLRPATITTRDMAVCFSGTAPVSVMILTSLQKSVAGVETPRYWRVVGRVEALVPTTCGAVIAVGSMWLAVQ